MHEFTNHLIDEKSPYLLQHAHNPVDWFPWGNEAFEKAKREDKPIFLSIGYSTCHWCHVMERESFEDSEAAEALNGDFVSIKVDREERPDIDAVYMSVCQAMTGSGGWPLTIIMTPDQKPFFAATYLPKHTRYGGLGLVELLTEVANQWRHDKKKLLSSGDEISGYISRQAERTSKSDEPTVELLRSAANVFRSSFDKSFGGFGNAPKFPSAHNLLFLLRYSSLEHDSSARSMAEKTLEQMYRGGIFDHIGGGFSRYSTDGRWLVPHFEKMLYDNAMLTMAYIEAYRLSGRGLFKTAAEKTINYVLNELSGQGGGFCCGQDADSDGVEGKYYVFTPAEIKKVLGEDDGNVFCRWFGITQAGNFEGKSILNLLDNKDFENENPHITELCEKLYKYRLERTRLHLDDKILTSWNGLIITALAKASQILDNQSYLQSAETAAKFIADNLTDKNGRLHVRWRDGEAAHAGQLDDYAFYCLALLELYRATFNAEYLEKAVFFAGQMISGFFDETNNGFYLNAEDSEQLIFRPKEVYDGAIPSGNSAAAAVLLDLAALTGETKWREYADRQLSFLAAHAKEYPVGFSFSLLAMTKALYPSAKLICVSAESEIPLPLKSFLNDMPLSNISVLFKTKQNERQLAAAAPFTAQYPIPDKGAVYYLCKNGACEKPTEDLEEIKVALKNNEIP